MNSLVRLAFFGLLSQAMATTTVDIEGTTYESFGLVGFGRIPADEVDKYGETIAPGSSIQIEKSSVTVDSNGVYHFTAWGLPDRGMNIDGTVNTYARIHKFSVDFTPEESSSSDNIIWTYEDTILLTDFNGDYLSGLDSNTTIEYNGLEIPAVVYHGDGWGNNLNSSTTTTRVSIDSEALAFVDGSIDNGFWISDEYGPSLMKFDSTGKMIDYIEAPGALLPHVNGELFFSSDDNYYFDQSYSVTENEDGRLSNHGYEGMDISPDGKYLFTLLQSATIQDGGEKSKNRYNSRLLKYDLTSSSTPTLVGEYVVVLPTYYTDAVKTAAQSEMRVINENLILVLPRDSDLGRGGEDGTTALFKHVDFYSLTDATNVMGLHDGVGEQIATSKGVLDSSITPATYYSFIDILETAELTKFGLHNGDPDTDHLINEKWEGMDLIPVQCTTDEYFLILISDSDYKTTNGFMDYGKITYDSDIDVDTQNLIYHIKLPSLTHSNSCAASSSSTVGSSSRVSSTGSSSSSSSTDASSTGSSSSSSSATPTGSASESKSSLTSDAPSTSAGVPTTSSSVPTTSSSVPTTSSGAPSTQTRSSTASSVESSSISTSFTESSNTSSSTVSSSTPSSSAPINIISDVGGDWSNGPVFSIIFQYANAIDALDTSIISSSGITSNADSFALYYGEDLNNFHRASFSSSANGLSMTETTDEPYMKLNFTGGYDESLPVFVAEFAIVYDINLNDLHKREVESTTVSISVANPSYTSSTAASSGASTASTTGSSDSTSTSTSSSVSTTRTSSSVSTTGKSSVVSTTGTSTSSSSDASADVVTSYTTYTTVTDGVTSTVTVPCTTITGSSTAATSGTAASKSYTTYTTVTNGVTVTVTTECSTSGSTSVSASTGASTKKDNTTGNTTTGTVAKTTTGSTSKTVAPTTLTSSIITKTTANSSSSSAAAKSSSATASVYKAAGSQMNAGNAIGAAIAVAVAALF